MHWKKTFLTFFLMSSLSVMAHQWNDLLDVEKLTVKIKTKNYAVEMKKLRKLDFDILGVDYHKKIVDVSATQAQIEMLKAQGLNIEVDYSQRLFKRVDSEYQNPEEIKSFLHKMSSDYPDLTELISIGKSSEGRQIWAIKISDNPNMTEASEPALLINSMHHAREVMTPEVAIDMVEYLLSRYGSDEKVKHWVDSNEIWVVPMLNVDGNAKVWSGKNMWRKNTAYGHGVDLNRNYPFNWNTCNGSSGYTWSQTYRGPGPASEPETKALMQLVADTRPVFDISYHSYSELVIYPLGCDGERTANKEVVEKIGDELGKSVNYKPGTAWELLYSVDGSDIDWMHGVYQVIPYVLEVSSSNQGFQPSYKQWRDKTVVRNRAGWQYLLDRLDGPGVRGMVVKGIKAIEKYHIKVLRGGETVHIYRGNPDGTFHIVLNPGEYTLELSAAGEQKIVRNVAIADERVEVNFNLSQ